MREGEPSRTAAWVAAARAMAARLPPEARLADDPYGAAFEDGPRARLHRALDRAHVPLHWFPPVTAWILYMQVRTRVIDDALRAFVASAMPGGDGARGPAQSTRGPAQSARGPAQSARGPAQIVLLGAGYDTRALRLPELAAARVFEVDHPATQARKRAVLERLGAASPAHYLTWNFERVPMAELPGALAAAGHDPERPTFTIWEGVTMYLTEPAIDASLRAIRAWSAPGSELAMTYFTKSRLAEPSLATRAVQRVVARFGEPWRFGWTPAELPGYLAARGFALRADRTISEAAHDLLPPRLARWVGASDRRVALAQAQESIALAQQASVGPGST